MPLFPPKHKKSLDKTDESKDFPAALSLKSYKVKKKKKKKMAEGGMIDDAPKKTLGEMINYPDSSSPSPKPAPKPKYADGGMVEIKKEYSDNALDEDEMKMAKDKKFESHGMSNEDMVDIDGPVTSEEMDMIREHRRMSRGGMVDEQDRPDSITEAIMRKRNMSLDSGMVDLEDASEEKPNYYDELNEMAADAPQYDDSQIDEQPEDSNEKGHEIDSDKHDMVSKIRSKFKKKS